MTGPTPASSVPAAIPMAADTAEMQDSAQELRKVAAAIDVALAAARAMLSAGAGMVPGYSIGPAATAIGADLMSASNHLANFARTHSASVQAGAEAFEITVQQGAQDVNSVGSRLV